MQDWAKEVGRAKESLEQRAFIVECTHEVPENSSLRVVERLDTKDGKTLYKVVPEKPEASWY